MKNFDTKNTDKMKPDQAFNKFNDRLNDAMSKIKPDQVFNQVKNRVDTAVKKMETKLSPGILSKIISLLKDIMMLLFSKSNDIFLKQMSSMNNILEGFKGLL